MGKYFGTDGIRGIVGEGLDAQLAFKTGLAAGTVLSELTAGRKPRVLIGRDTRISGDMLESALAAGLCSTGADVTLIGVLPTPAVAFLTVKSSADMGVVISASHNPYEHNGIKIFGKNGYKLSDALEERIESLIDDDTGIKNRKMGELGVITRAHEQFSAEYIGFLASKAQGSFTGRIAVDCANGAAVETARRLFTELGADFEIICDAPDGVNINVECGSTYIGTLRDKVRGGGFDLGLAFDGDADRCLAVDGDGEIVDGDMLLAVFARAMMADGTLKGGAAVGTSVSNSGMEVFARNNCFEFLRSDVGDRNVLEMMRERGCNLGGESSGHMIFSDDATTGDGQMTAVKLMSVLAASGNALSELVRDIPHFPQVMISFMLTGGKAQRDAIMVHPKLAEEIKTVEGQLAGEGRVLIRPSGTEPVIRVLVEAKTEALAIEKAEYLVGVMGLL